jgi:hypothetical protein
MSELHAERRRLLVEACELTGWRAPRDGEGLARWVDESIPSDIPMGSPAWQLVYAETLGAFEAVLRGDGEGARVRLERAMLGQAAASGRAR